MQNIIPDKGHNDLADESRLNKVLLDSMPCTALIIKKYSHEIAACNAVARQLGAVVGKTCLETIARAAPSPGAGPGLLTFLPRSDIKKSGEEI